MLDANDEYLNDLYTGIKRATDQLMEGLILNNDTEGLKNLAYVLRAFTIAKRDGKTFEYLNLT